MERLEIRHLIKTFKSKDLPPLHKPFPIPSLASQSTAPVISKPQASSLSPLKPKKSSVTEELDRQFRKLRSHHPNEDLIYVKPSLIQKDTTFIPSPPSLDELKQKAQTQRVNVSEFCIAVPSLTVFF